MSIQPSYNDNRSLLFVENFLVGKIAITRENTIEFRYGLPGFETLTKFLFAGISDNAPFYLLQSIEDPDVSMLILDINYIEIPIHSKIPKKELKEVSINGGPQEGDIGIYVVLRYDRSTSSFTANVKAPLILNLKDRLGRQIIIDDASLSNQHPLNPI